MQIVFKYLLLLTLSGCIDIIIKQDEPPAEDDLDIVRILDERYPLMKAAKTGRLDEVKRLLEIEVFKKNVDQQDEDGNTALIFAAEQGHEDILNLLLENGADPHRSDFKKRTPLMNAAYKGKMNIIKRLLQIDTVKEQIDAPDINGNTALIFAARRGHDEILDLLQQAGADPNRGNFRKRTPLINAALKGQTHIISKLLQIETVKQNINERDKDGNTAFIFAARKGHDDILDTLLENDANPVLGNFRERTPLMEAVLRGKVNSVTKLLQIEAVKDKDHINATDINGHTALSLAKSENHTEIATLLEENGALPRPIKDSFLNIKRSFKKLFFERTGEENQLRKTATKSEEWKDHSPSFFERIRSFFKNLF